MTWSLTKHLTFGQRSQPTLAQQQGWDLWQHISRKESSESCALVIFTIFFLEKKALICATHKTGHRKPTITSNALCIHKFYHQKELPLPTSFTYSRHDCMPAGKHCPIHPPTSDPFNKFHFQQRNSFLKWRHKQLLQVSNAYLASACSPIQKHIGYDPLMLPFMSEGCCAYSCTDKELTVWNTSLFSIPHTVRPHGKCGLASHALFGPGMPPAAAATWTIHLMEVFQLLMEKGCYCNTVSAYRSRNCCELLGRLIIGIDGYIKKHTQKRLHAQLLEERLRYARWSKISHNRILETSSISPKNSALFPTRRNPDAVGSTCWVVTTVLSAGSGLRVEMHICGTSRYGNANG